MENEVTVDLEGQPVRVSRDLVLNTPPDQLRSVLQQHAAAQKQQSLAITPLPSPTQFVPNEHEGILEVDGTQQAYPEGVVKALTHSELAALLQGSEGDGVGAASAEQVRALNAGEDQFKVQPEPHARAPIEKDISDGEEFLRGLGRAPFHLMGNVERLGRLGGDAAQIGAEAFKSFAQMRHGIPGPSFGERFENLDLLTQNNELDKFGKEFVPAGDPTSFGARTGDLAGTLAGPGLVTGAVARTPQLARYVRSKLPGAPPATIAGTPTRNGLSDQLATERAVQEGLDATRGVLGVPRHLAKSSAVAASAVGTGEYVKEQFDSPIAGLLAELATAVAVPSLGRGALNSATRYAMPPNANAGAVHDAALRSGIEPAPEMLSQRGRDIVTAQSATQVLGQPLDRRLKMNPAILVRGIREQINKLRASEGVPPRDVDAGHAQPGQKPMVRLGAEPPDANLPDQPTIGGIGEQLRGVAEAGTKRIDDEVKVINNEVTNLGGGPDAMLPAADFNRMVRDVENRPSRFEHDTVENFRALVQNVRDTMRPMDQALDAQLRTQRATIKAKIDELSQPPPAPSPLAPPVSQAPRVAPPDPGAQMAQAQRELANIDTKLDANMGINFDALRSLRTTIGPKASEKNGLDAFFHGHVYATMTDMLKKQVGLRGPGAVRRFDEIMDRQVRLNTKRGLYTQGRDREALEQVKATGTQADAYGWLDHGGKELGVERFKLLEEHMNPQELMRFKADFLELQLRTSNGRQDSLSAKPSLDVLQANWARFSRPLQEWFSETVPGGVSKMDDLMRAADGVAGRMPNTATHQLTAAEDAAKAALDPVALAKPESAGKLLANTMLLAGLLSRKTADAIAERGPGIGERTFKHTAQGVAAQVPTAQERLREE